ncbi:hypothetical protein ABE10_12220 [Bacillus toyonensis]|nr:hypothetical protein [Bacillus toyonensis]
MSHFSWVRRTAKARLRDEEGLAERGLVAAAKEKHHRLHAGQFTRRAGGRFPSLCGYGLLPLLLPRRGDEARDRRDRHRGEDDAERHPVVDVGGPLDGLAAVDERQLVLVHRVQDELDPDEAEDEGHAVVEVAQLLQQVAEEEVELTQTHQREEVRGEHDERILRDAIDRGDRVDGEHEVGDADRDEHDEHRCPDLLPVHHSTQFRSVVLIADVDAATEHPDDEVLCLRVVVVLLGHRLSDRREDEERAEHVEDRAQGLYRGSDDEDEDGSQHERDDDPDHQHLLLIAPRDRELRHDQHEDEEVVDREAVLHRPSGDEVDRVLRVAEQEQESREDERERHVEGHPQRRLPGGGDVRALQDQEQVGEQDEREHHQRGDLEPDRDFHGRQGPFERVGQDRKSLPRDGRGARPGASMMLRDDERAMTGYSLSP